VKILVVDDDRGTLTLLGLYLARAGHDVSGSGDVLDAAARLADERFDWLVVDGQLGADDGRRLAADAKLRQPGLRAVMISGFYEKADVAGGAVERLFPKPVDTDALLAHLRTAPAPR
jgi:DNA-binding NtrC family response regulator